MDEEEECVDEKTRLTASAKCDENEEFDDRDMIDNDPLEDEVC